MVDNIKGCFAWFDLDLMFGLTQIWATSKACWQTGVNLLVTFTIDIEKQASALRKKLEQIKFKLDNPDLTPTKRAQLEDQVDAINAQLNNLHNLGSQNSRGQCTSEASITGERGKPSQGYVLGKPFNKPFNWPTDCKTYSTVGWPGEGPLAEKSSAALNTQRNYVKHVGQPWNYMKGHYFLIQSRSHSNSKC